MMFRLLPRGFPSRLIFLLAGLASTAHAQRSPPDPYAPVSSMGLPPHATAYAGMLGVADGIGGNFGAGGWAFAGIRHELIKPLVGLFGVAAEGYGGVVGGSFDGGGRLFATIRAFQLQAGMDFRSSDVWPPVVTVVLEDPVNRGGLFHRGGNVRFEWTPAAERIALGISMPIFDRWAGKSRPRDTHVPVPYHRALPNAPPPDTAVRRQLDQLRESAAWIDLLTTPFVESALLTDREWMAELEQHLAYMNRTDDEFPRGHTFPEEVSAYHRRLEGLFAHALGVEPGDARAGELTRRARRILLEEVVLPANHDFGRLRRETVFEALRQRAARRFADSAAIPPLVPDSSHAGVIAAHEGWLQVIGEVGREARKRWDDSRLAWIPFQLALRPEDHDTQQEMDALLEQLVGEPFQAGNDVTYLVNEAFSPELVRTIHAARDYHVLWIHDFPGTAPDGRTDRVGARVVTEGYLAALTERVRAFDSTGSIPTFMIFLDQWYFDQRHGRWWTRLLLHPLGRDMKLPREAVKLQEAIRTAQQSLRDAVAGSKRLQQLRAERGDKWLHQYVRVHVSITFRGDPSFRRRVPAKDVAMLFADDYMRDHKKVVFYDLTERDPVRGAALFTGEGVGEHYEGALWEDRTLLVRGPSALPLKREARALLLSQGVKDSEIPSPLRAEPFPDDYEARADSLSQVWPARILQAHNAVGYGEKHASVLKAALYNLMPAGSRLLVPDSQWSSFFWAGMLVGTALRGGQVYIIAPRNENAPYGDSEVQTVLTHDVLEGYLQLSDLLTEAFEESGGSLRVGLYGRDIDTRSIGQRYRAVIEGLVDPGFPRAAFPFGDDTYRQLGNVDLLQQLLAPAQSQPVEAPADGGSRAPSLHLKSQLFASGEGFERLLRDPAWFQVFVNYVATRGEEVARDPKLAAAGAMTPRLLAPVDSSLHQAPARERARDLFYLTNGSHNQNDRSLLLDGEILCLVAGPESLAPLIDFVAIAALSTWVETPEELDRLIPRLPRGTVRMARALRSVF
jgi:hypothetical protein